LVLGFTWVAVGKQRAHGEKDLGDGESRAPVVFQDIEANDAVAVNITVVDLCAEHHL